jgi:hypothetical protein
VQAIENAYGSLKGDFGTEEAAELVAHRELGKCIAISQDSRVPEELKAAQAAIAGARRLLARIEGTGTRPIPPAHDGEED